MPSISCSCPVKPCNRPYSLHIWLSSGMLLPDVPMILSPLPFPVLCRYSCGLFRVAPSKDRHLQSRGMTPASATGLCRQPSIRKHSCRIPKPCYGHRSVLRGVRNDYNTMRCRAWSRPVGFAPWNIHNKSMLNPFLHWLL